MLQSSLVNCLQLWIILLVLVKNPKNMNGPFQRHSRPLEAHKVSSVPLVNPNQGGIGSTCAVCTSPHLFYKSHDDKLADLVSFHSHWDQGHSKYFPWVLFPGLERRGVSFASLDRLTFVTHCIASASQILWKYPYAAHRAYVNFANSL